MSIVSEGESMEAEVLTEVLTEALPERSRAKGAHVLLAGRTREKLEAVARDVEGEWGICGRCRTRRAR